MCIRDRHQGDGAAGAVHRALGHRELIDQVPLPVVAGSRVVVEGGRMLELPAPGRASPVGVFKVPVQRGHGVIDRRGAGVGAGGGVVGGAELGLGWGRIG